MRVMIERANLLQALTHIQRIVERRNTIPILGNVLIRAQGNELSLKATDLDLELVEAIPASCEDDGATTVPAHLFYEIVRKLPDGSQVSLNVLNSASSIELKAGRARFSMQVLPEGDFPDLTAEDFSHTFSIKEKELKALIDRTQFAISNEETRYYLNGIYFHTIEEDGSLYLRAVATDGHRLARSQLNAPNGSEGMPGIIVSRKTVAEVHRLLSDDENDVRVELSENKIRFTIGSAILTAKLIDGTFPDYMRVIPLNNDKKMLADCDEFRMAVDRVSTISSERGRAIKMSLTNNKLELVVNNPETGSAVEELAVEYDFEDLDIGFNAKYLLEIAGQLQGDSVTFTLADPGSPTLIENPTDRQSLYVLMPMRV